MARFMSSLLLGLLVHVQCKVLANEHRVHNIMLYPEKHSWCKLTPITQVITHLGCKAQEIENHVCVGACFSFSVPRTIPETPGDDKLYYCDSCQPLNVTWTNVILQCADTNEPRISKMVEIISDCSCRSCSGKVGSGGTPRSNHSSDEASAVIAAIVNARSGGSGDADVDGISKSGSDSELDLSSAEEEEEEDDEDEEEDDEDEEGLRQPQLPHGQPGLLRPIPHTQVIIHKKVMSDKTSAEEGPTANLIPDTPISEREQILKQMKEKNPEQFKVLGEPEEDDVDDGAVPMQKS